MLITLSTMFAKRVSCYISQSPLFRPYAKSFCSLDQLMFVPTYTHLCNLILDETCHDQTSESLSLSSQRNFASRGGGASIIPDFTSETYGRTACSGSQIAMVICNLQNNYYINPPSVVLEEDITEGECWEFLGERVQITINLTESVKISHISIGHPSPHLLSPHSCLRAPRAISVWAFVNGIENLPQGVNETSTLLRNMHQKTYRA